MRHSHLNPNPPSVPTSSEAGIAGKLLATAVSTVIVLAVLELACRMWLPVPQLRVFSSLMDGAAVVGTFRNHAFHWKAPEFAVDVRLNDLGYREDFSFALSELDVAFMGDSFAFGQGVDIADRYTNVAAAFVPGKKAASLAYPNGWQPEHYEYFLRNNPQLKPRVLVVGLYLGNDLDSDVKETVATFDDKGYVESLTIPAREVFDGYMITRGIYPLGLGTLAKYSYTVRLLLIALNGSATWRDYLVRRSPGVYPPNSPNSLPTELGRFDEFSNRAFDSLKRIRSMLMERGGELIVLVIPQNFYVGPSRNPHIARENTSSLDEIVRSGGLKAEVLTRCAQAQLACVDPTPILATDDYFTFDPHWTPAGHRKVGEWLGRIMKSYW